jgi:hypothetical protein
MSQYTFDEIFDSRSRTKKFIDQCMSLDGFYTDFEIIRNGKSVLYIPKFFNGITNAGKNNLLGVYFYDGTQSAASSWSTGLIATTGYTALNAADTMGSHTGWTEFTTYMEATRVAWGQEAPASQAINNGATPITFNIDTVTVGTQIAGIFICNQNTKGGSTGILWSTGAFPSGHATINTSDEVRTNYGVSI